MNDNGDNYIAIILVILIAIISQWDLELDEIVTKHIPFP